MKNPRSTLYLVHSSTPTSPDHCTGLGSEKLATRDKGNGKTLVQASQATSVEPLFQPGCRRAPRSAANGDLAAGSSCFLSSQDIRAVREERGGDGEDRSLLGGGEGKTPEWMDWIKGGV